MSNAAKACDQSGKGIGLLEKELAERKERLAKSKADLHHRFESYADEKACVAALEKALAKAHHLL
ncbi:hypothetical protein [Pseudomonas sp. MS15a(2019)]|uniref:hypothetical protein n=1 Tax=Pseudomonas sp. MS15a(2019) TaxID=2579938 RepID=UPI001565ED70|nr:hypothetical protein [Pseudomonas sp. MS15a(2019)]NRH40670.1 hypothetical protein [Pseudomonas sp. MS15a(2019)]